MVPLIGITCNRVGAENRLSAAYVRAVAKSGATPILFPVCGMAPAWRRMLETVDGLLLSGGGDLDAYLYGEEAQPGQGQVQPGRDRMELFFARSALREGVPVLGICRGAQMMAVAAGGTLIQDLAGIERVQHDQKAPRTYPIHRVTLKKQSLLYNITAAETFRVNSLHHQAIKEAGKGMSVCAVADDGVAEAVECAGHPFALGVQWHPEWLRQSHAQALFAALTAAAAKAGKTRISKR